VLKHQRIKNIKTLLEPMVVFSKRPLYLAELPATTYHLLSGDVAVVLN